jgi:hypothetical protein
VIDSLREGGRFDAIPVSRGASPDENIELAVRFRVLAASKEERS